MKSIQMVDLRSQYEAIKKEVNHEIQEVIDSCSFINGQSVREFSNDFSKYLNVSQVIPCGNGTDALQVAIMALDLKRGDEVILPAFTYIATAEVLALLGLKPRFVDVEDDYFGIDVSQIEKAISEKTKVILPVHLFGQSSNMEQIMKIARSRELLVIEDAAQSTGTKWIQGSQQTSTGCIGDIGTTSFFPSKNLGCYGDGGAIMTNDETLGKKIRQLANHGQSEKYYHDMVGVNSRLDTIQAAILKVKLKHLDTYIESRLKVANEYDQAFSDIAQIKIPMRAPFSTHSFHQYTIHVLDDSRDDLKKFLSKNEIPSMIYYPVPIHLQKGYRYLGYSEGDFPVAERLCRNVLSLPIHTEMSTEQQDYIIEKIRKFYGK